MRGKNGCFVFLLLIIISDRLKSHKVLNLRKVLLEGSMKKPLSGPVVPKSAKVFFTNDGFLFVFLLPHPWIVYCYCKEKLNVDHFYSVTGRDKISNTKHKVTLILRLLPTEICENFSKVCNLTFFETLILRLNLCECKLFRDIILETCSLTVIKILLTNFQVKFACFIVTQSLDLHAVCV